MVVQATSPSTCPQLETKSLKWRVYVAFAFSAAAVSLVVLLSDIVDDIHDGLWLWKTVRNFWQETRFFEVGFPFSASNRASPELLRPSVNRLTGGRIFLQKITGP